MASCASKGSTGSTVGAGSASPAVSVAAMAAHMAGLVVGAGGTATVSGLSRVTAAVPLATVNLAGSMVTYMCPSWEVHDGMFMAFSLSASWKLSRKVKHQASVAEEMRGMAYSCVRNSSLMFSVFD